MSRAAGAAALQQQHSGSGGSSSEDESSDDAELPPCVCEACGSTHAQRIMLRCKHWGPDHCVGVHTFCLPIPHGVPLRDPFVCLNCTAYAKRAGAVLADAQAARADAVRRKKGLPLGPEVMPELRPIQAPAPRVRRAGNIKLQPTAQQRIDAAARAQKTDSAAAGGASSSSSSDEEEAGGEDGGRPGKRQKVQAGAAAAAGAGRGGAGRKAHPAAAAAAAAGGDGDGWRTKKGARPAPQQQQQPQQQKTRLKGFAASLNAGHKAGVRAALQDKARAVQEQARAGAGRPAAAGAAAGAASGGAAGHSTEQTAGAAAEPGAAPAAAAAAAGGSDAAAEKGDAFTQKLLHAHISCQLVLTGVQPGQSMDPAEARNYFGMRGMLVRSKPAERSAQKKQQLAHKQMLRELQALAQPDRPAFAELTGGVFDTALHPSIERFAGAPELSYRPLKVVPHSEDDRQAVRELLLEPRRFAVISVGARLLVLLPTAAGELLALATRAEGDMDDLTREVVRSIMSDPAIQSRSSEPPASESLHGAAAGEGEEEEDNKANVVILHPPAAAAPAAAPAGDADYAADALLSGDAQDAQAGGGQQQQEAELDEVTTQGSALAPGGAPARKPLPVRPLPAGMSVAHLRRQQQQVVTSTVVPASMQMVGVAALARTPLTATNALRSTPPASAPGAGSRQQRTGSSALTAQEAVERSSLCQLLSALRDPQQQRRYCQQELPLAGMLPQLQDLCALHQLRLFLVGFSEAQLESSPYLAACLQSARALVAELHVGPAAVPQLLRQLGLQQAAAAAEAAAAAAGPSNGGTPSAAVRVKQEAQQQAVSPMQVDFIDLTQEEAGSCSCRCVLLLPEHAGSAQLQEALGALPLWQLLASPVAVFSQGASAGPLQWLHAAKQQRQHQQREADAAAAGGDSGQHSQGRQLQLPQEVAQHQRYCGGVTVVANCSSLACSSKQQIRQLLGCLQACRAAQQRHQHALGLPGAWRLCLTQSHLDSLPASRLQLLQEGLQDGSVMPLDLVLHPGSLDEAEEAGSLLANAASLAEQQQQHTRLVVAVVPDLQEPPSTPPAAAAAAAAAGPSAGAVAAGRQPIDPALRHLAQQTLQLGSAQPAVLSGSMSQLLALLRCCAESGRQQGRHE